MLHSVNEFYLNQSKPRELFAYLYDKFEYTEGDSVDMVSQNIDTLLKIMRADAPKIIVTPSYYGNAAKVFDSASYTIRPSSKAECRAPVLKRSFSINAGANVYVRFIKEFEGWLDLYHDIRLMYENLDFLQKMVDEIIETEGIPFKVSFDIGSGILDISDNDIVLGIEQDTVMGLAQLFFCNSCLYESSLQQYKGEFVDILKACAKPMDIVKQGAAITRALGIFSRKAITTLVRKVVTRRIDYTRVGIGYYASPEEGWFTVIQKSLLTDEEADKVLEDNPDAFIIDNINSTIAERANGQLRILVQYKLSPFNANRESVDIAIRDIPNVMSANVGA